ncbi:MAG: S41 family peptidase [Pseudomonadota bacterium]
MIRVIAVAALTATACASGPQQPTEPVDTPSGQIANLHALAQLYGAVRWFHPSDEAAVIDWDRYATLGVREVRFAGDAGELRRALQRWVAPVGPSVQILADGQQAMQWTTDAASPQVAWQHTGPGFDGGQARLYQSRRTNRTGEAFVRRGWVSSVQTIDAAPLRGNELRLRAQVRAGAGARVGAWLRIDRENGETVFFDNMMDRAVTGSTWTGVTIEGPVAEDAGEVVFGGFVIGKEGWLDAFTLEVTDSDGGWRPLRIANPEMDDGVAGWQSGTRSLGPANYELVVEQGAPERGSVLRLAPQQIELTEDLFDERPAAGEVAVVALGSGLRAHVPLSLASVDGQTVPAGDLAAARALISSVTTDSSDDADIRVADVIVAWNVLAHFYPYHDVIGTPWPQALGGLLAKALVEQKPGRHGETLKHLLAAIEDGHGNVYTGDPEVGLPVRFGLVEGRVVVLVSSAAELERGDIVVSIDGVAADEALRRRRELASGSPQWRTVSALNELGSGAENSVAALNVRRDGEVREVRLARGRAHPPPLYSYSPVGEIRPGVWLIDMSRAEMEEIDARIASIAGAPGVVIDMRGYPNRTSDILTHLLPTQEHARWMHVARLIRPNLPGAAPPKWNSFGWELSPRAPRISGNVVFLTGPRAISYAESVMGYVEALGLPIVGAATAGTNGNTRTVTLPSGARFVFTGMKVTRHDGSRSHLEGIEPTVPAARTIAGVRAGRDEVLERALELIAASQ